MLEHQQTMMWKSFILLKFTTRLIGFVSDSLNTLTYFITYSCIGAGLFGPITCRCVTVLEEIYHG